MYKKQQSTINFLHGESYTHYVLPYEKIESHSPASPGLYSWHIRLRPGFESITTVFLEELFQQSVLHAEVSGTLRLNYSGQLYKQSSVLSEQFDNSLLSEALMMIPSPLYIGITENLRTRLSCHKKNLNDALQRGLTSDLYESSLRADSDSDDESRNFGERLGSFWKRNRFFEPHTLCVKFLVPRWCDREQGCACGSNCRQTTRDMLREAETACNTLFNPVFGRR